VVEVSNSHVTSGSRRPLAADIDKPPLLTCEKLPMTGERYAIDSKLVLNSFRKAWSLYRLITSLPVCDVTELVN
jgi:hypothetical protein